MIAMIERRKGVPCRGNRRCRSYGEETVGALRILEGGQCGLRGRQEPGLGELSWP